MHLLKIKFHIFPKRDKNSYYKKLSAQNLRLCMFLTALTNYGWLKNVVLKCKASDMLFITSQCRVHTVTSLPWS